MVEFNRNNDAIDNKDLHQKPDSHNSWEEIAGNVWGGTLKGADFLVGVADRVFGIDWRGGSLPAGELPDLGPGAHTTRWPGRAKDGARVTAEAGAQIVAEKGSYVDARDQSNVVAKEGSYVEARSGSYVGAIDGTVIAHHGAKVIASGHSSVIAKDGSKVGARAGATVVAEEGSYIVAEKGAKVEGKGTVQWVDKLVDDRKDAHDGPLAKVLYANDLFEKSGKVTSEVALGYEQAIKAADAIDRKSLLAEKRDLESDAKTMKSEKGQSRLASIDQMIQSPALARFAYAMALLQSGDQNKPQVQKLLEEIPKFDPNCIRDEDFRKAAKQAGLNPDALTTD